MYLLSYVAFFFLSLTQSGASLEQTHIFVLAHILRRPIIVYGVKYYKSFRGETLGYTRFQGEAAGVLAGALAADTWSPNAGPRCGLLFIHSASKIHFSC